MIWKMMKIIVLTWKGFIPEKLLDFYSPFLGARKERKYTKIVILFKDYPQWSVTNCYFLDIKQHCFKNFRGLYDADRVSNRVIAYKKDTYTWQEFLLFVRFNQTGYKGFIK